MFGVSFALWSLSVPQTSTNTFTSGCLNLTLTDKNSSAINLSAQYPITDEVANGLTPYTFEVKNTCSTEENYRIDLDVMKTSTLDIKNIKFKFDSDSPAMLSGALASTPYDATATIAKTLKSGVIKGNTTESHTLTLWMADSVTLSSEVQEKTFNAKIVVTATPKTN